jgi:hypothetical protein
MKLSVCLMVRDEEKNLPRALDSVREVADEILVVDTGSADATVSIAESRGARVFHYDWHDDFSAPHNFLWEQARGEWLLWLDGDESLVASSIPNLRQCIQRTDVGGFYIQRQEIVDEAEPDRFTEMLMLRLHRKNLRTRFVGKYHNQIVPPGRDCPPGERWLAVLSEVKLKHWRFKADELLRSRRAALILGRELEEEPDNLYVMVELANSLSDLGDPRAEELRLRAARMLRPGDERPPTLAVIYTIDHMICHPAEAAKTGLSFEDYRSMCRRWFPRNAPLKWAIARRLFSENDFANAAVELAEVIRLVKTDDLDKVIPFDPRVAEDAEFNLGVCLIRLAMVDEAERIFKGMLSSPRRAEEARMNLEAIAELRKL